MNTTTDEIRSKRILRVAWGVAIGLHLIALVVLINNKGLLTESLTFSRIEADQQVAAVEKRAQKREALEKQRREKIILRKEDAEHLSKKEENKRRDLLVQRVEKIKEDYEAIKQIEQAKIDLLHQDLVNKFNKRHAKQMDDLTNNVNNWTRKLKVAIKNDPELENLNVTTQVILNRSV